MTCWETQTKMLWCNSLFHYGKTYDLKKNKQKENLYKKNLCISLTCILNCTRDTWHALLTTSLISSKVDLEAKLLLIEATTVLQTLHMSFFWSLLRGILILYTGGGEGTNRGPVKNENIKKWKKSKIIAFKVKIMLPY